MDKKTKKDVSARVVLASLKKKVQPIVNKLEDLEIEDQTDYERAGKLLKTIKAYVKEAEVQRRSKVDKLNAVVKEINADYKSFTEPMKKLETEVKQRMLEWHEEVEDNKQELIEAYEEDAPISSQLRAAPVDNSSRYSSTKRIDEYIYNVKEIPSKYLLPNEPAIKAAIKAGKRIPGVKVRKRPVIAI